jgi:hypothetical protein
MTSKERFLAGEIFTLSYGVTRYKFDGDRKSPGIEFIDFRGDLQYFTSVQLGASQVKWSKMILGQWHKGSFKFTDLKFISEAKEGGEIK